MHKNANENICYLAIFAQIFMSICSPDFGKFSLIFKLGRGLYLAPNDTEENP